MEKHDDKEDAARWNVLVHKEDENNIPHYIPIQTGKGEKETEDFWFVSEKDVPLNVSIVRKHDIGLQNAEQKRRHEHQKANIQESN